MIFCWWGREGDAPTGFHFIIPLKREVSCSSVQGSVGKKAAFVEGGAVGVWGVEGRCFGVEWVEGEGLREESRAFFLGGMVFEVVWGWRGERREELSWGLAHRVL